MSPETVARPTIRTSYLAVVGPVAVCVFVIGTVAASLTWPEYDHRVQPLSDLAGTAAPVPSIQTLTFVAFGVAVIGLGAGLSAAGFGRRVAVLVVGFGGAMATLAIFPCSPGCAAGTPTDLAHSAVAVVGFVAVAAAMLLVGRGVAGSDPVRRGSAVTGVATLALLIAWLVALEIDPVAWSAGSIQRGLVGTVLLWVGGVGRRLDRAVSIRDAASQ